VPYRDLVSLSDGLSDEERGKHWCQRSKPNDASCLSFSSGSEWSDAHGALWVKGVFEQQNFQGNSTMRLQSSPSTRNGRIGRSTSYLFTRPSLQYLGVLPDATTDLSFR